ncbi:histidinol-phosphate aminotransferase [Buchnera aphidicola (Diuraphis noxia)]|uniref:Histidinol-phosphate aminotransferase n=2 Tax=Buchnera aphidicola subsp. Diuraphis noxia TaxID=118101 RepID=HIS8_BUCDN|nr:histidinol-phosphate transaminase [Buchnera aphidicola]Q84I53.1 RecName: Full=Histidinol-phosphate aminotransferase; AltName: Full=Imidazole acetol-phosphate transaminase [Buchnera aphidicola (Diuraphis noxia)]AAO33045.1 histidinolphosphate aminotransferase [Buchnera aphidicola]ANZ22342.1 histidinol-phosphate aminotransferase [Buchnera aphidicola (Diuraphis noxia)]
MINSLIKLARINVQKLQPYQSARRIGGQHGDVWLNANESPVSVELSFKKKLLNRYPECQPIDLISAYADYVRLSTNQILVTRGADEGIELLIRAFCESGKDAIIYCPPTYDMYRVNAEIYNIKYKEVPTIKNTWQLDLLNIKLNLNSVKLIYICNPNNPTGSTCSKKDLFDLLEMTLNTSLVVVDEAYIEFLPKESMTLYLKKYPNLVILRTLSKAFALAGIRCGFVLAQKEIINILNKIISPYPISIPTASIALESLHKNYIKLMQNRVLDLNANRVWLINKLKKISSVKKIFQSNTNYILVQFFMSEEIFQMLWEKGIIVRNQDHKINLKQCLRITVGTHLECSRLIEEIKFFSKKYLKGV